MQVTNDIERRPAPHEGFHMYAIAQAHTAINRAWTAATPGITNGMRPTDVLAFTRDAHARLQDAVAHEGPDDALTAAHAVLPRVTRAVELLAALGGDLSEAHVNEVLREFATVMDQLEATLDAAGWD